MKKIVFLIMIVIAGAASAFAQHKMDPAKAEELFNSRVQNIQKQLELTPEQTAKFAPVYKNYLESVRKIKRPARPANVENADQAYTTVINGLNYKKSIIDAQQVLIKNLKPILTPQQLVKVPMVEQRIQDKIMGSKNKHKHGDNAKKKGCQDKNK